LPLSSAEYKIPVVSSISPASRTRRIGGEG